MPLRHPAAIALSGPCTIPPSSLLTARSVTSCSHNPPTLRNSFPYILHDSPPNTLPAGSGPRRPGPEDRSPPLPLIKICPELVPTACSATSPRRQRQRRRRRRAVPARASPGTEPEGRGVFSGAGRCEAAAAGPRIRIAVTKGAEAGGPRCRPVIRLIQVTGWSN